MLFLEVTLKMLKHLKVNAGVAKSMDSYVLIRNLKANFSNLGSEARKCNWVSETRVLFKLLLISDDGSLRSYLSSFGRYVAKIMHPIMRFPFRLEQMVCL